MSDIRYITWHVREPSFRFTIDRVQIMRNPYYPSERLGKNVEVSLLSREFGLKWPVDEDDYPLRVEKSDLMPKLDEACKRIMKAIWQ